MKSLNSAFVFATYKRVTKKEALNKGVDKMWLDESFVSPVLFLFAKYSD
jgi:hypothetical protein